MSPGQVLAWAGTVVLVASMLALVALIVTAVVLEVRKQWRAGR